MIAPKKVCMFVYNNYKPDARVEKEARSLIQKGYEVTIIALQGKGFQNHEKVDGYEIIRVEKKPIHLFFVRIARRVYRITKRVIHIITTGKDIHDDNDSSIDNQNLSYIKTSRFRTILKNILLPIHAPLCYLDFALRAKKVAKPKNFDIFHSHDLTGLPAAYMSQSKKEQILIYDSHELFTEISIARGLQQKFYCALEKYLIKKANFVITVNPFIAKELETRYSIQLPTVILNCPPKTNFRIESYRSQLRTLPGVHIDLPIILYQGGYSPNRGLETLVQSMKYLPNYQLVMMGWGRIEGNLRHISRENSLENRVIFVPPAPQKDLLKFTCGADIGVIPYLHIGMNNYLCSPNKLFEYMNAGVPIVASHFPFLKQVIESENIGQTFDPTSEESIAKSIDKILKDSKQLAQYRENCIRAADIYNWEREQKKLIELYSTI